MTLKQVKKDLQDIRYYYMHKEMFAKAENTGFKSEVERKTEQYVQLISKAPPRLYVLYYLLYVDGKTQYAAAQDLNVTDGHIRNMARQLQQFLLDEINREGGKVNGGYNDTGFS